MNSSHTVRMVLLGIVAFTALVVVVVLIAGPKCMQIAFGKKFTYDRLGLLLVTFGMGLYLASVTVNQACIAQGQVRRAAARWITCAALFIAWNFVRSSATSTAGSRSASCSPPASSSRSSSGSTATRTPHEGDTPQPGSPEELEARLAMIDENI